MPYTIVEREGEFCVVKKDNPKGKPLGCHKTKKEAVAQIGAIESREHGREKKELCQEDALATMRYMFHQQYPPAPTDDINTMIDVVATYDKHVIVSKGLRFFKVPYKGTAPDFTFGEETAWVEMEPGWNKKSGFKMLPNGKWFGWWTNAFEDREKELFYTDSIQEFIDYWDKTKEALPLYWWHIPYDLGVTEWLGLAGHIAMAAGSLNKEGERFASYYEAHPEIELGMSHKFVWDAKQVDGEGGYKWFRSKELTFLPRGKAANPFTTFEGVNKMNEEKKEELAKIIGAEEAEKRLADTEAKSKEIQDANVKFKEAEDKTVEPAPIAPVEDKKDVPIERFVMDDALIAEIAAKVAVQLEPAFARIAEIFKPAVSAMEGQAKEVHDAMDVLLKADGEKVKAILDKLPRKEIYRAKNEAPPAEVIVSAPKVKTPAEIMSGNLSISIADISSARGV